SAIDAAAIASHASALTDGLDPAKAPGGALYAPWLRVAGACPACGGSGAIAGAACATGWGGGSRFAPPSGHRAGRRPAPRPRSAPATAAVRGVVALQGAIDGAAQAATGLVVNAVRALPGRGLRVWGARTLSADPAWRYVNVRRLMSTLTRWLEERMASAAFEP